MYGNIQNVRAVSGVDISSLSSLARKQADMDKWSRLTYGEAFSRMAENPEYGRAELDALRGFLFDPLRENGSGQIIAQRRMDGNSVLGIGNKNNGAANIRFNEVYRDMGRTGFTGDLMFSPVHFLYTFIQHYLHELPAVPVETMNPDIARSLHYYPSALREECLSLALQAFMPDAEVSSSILGDSYHKTDFCIRYRGPDGAQRFLRVWSYQSTADGLNHLYSKVTGRRGALDSGLHLFAPLPVRQMFADGRPGKSGVYNPCMIYDGWYLYSWEYVDHLICMIRNLFPWSAYRNLLGMKKEDVCAYLGTPRLIYV